MEPVKSHWKEHELLGASLINGLRSAGIPIWNDGTLPMDLTQTSYSTIASVDLEIGDSSSDYSEAALGKVVQGIKDGLDMFFEKAFMAELERANTHDALVAENGSFLITYTDYMKDGTIRLMNRQNTGMRRGRSTGIPNIQRRFPILTTQRM